ncbi:MAG TPA: metallophosphoesterase [Polyangiaceae bacterium]|nr:metallophosphoesterase [Polyangiaceae bacterium]
MILAIVLTTLAYACLYGLWPALRSRRGSALFWGTALFVFGVWMLARWFDGRFSPPAGWLVSTWIGASLVCVGLGVALILLRGVGGLARRIGALSSSPSVDEGRRRFLGGGLALPGIAVSIGAGGASGGAGEFSVRHVDVRIPDLPRALHGFRVGQITDVHIGDFIQPEYLARAVDAMNQANVHLQVMTGDLIDDLRLLEPTFEALARCRAPHGMLAVLGNHEKFRDLDAVLAAYDRHQSGPVRLLVDESTLIQHDGAALRVVGVDYPMRRSGPRATRREQRLAMMQASAETAFRGVGPHETLLCLSHHPDFFRFAEERGAALTLAGHTHGGQVAFLGRSLLQTYEHMFGLYERNRGQLYVSGGTGHWLPFRVGVPTEVTILTLHTA